MSRTCKDKIREKIESLMFDDKKEIYTYKHCLTNRATSMRFCHFDKPVIP